MTTKTKTISLRLPTELATSLSLVADVRGVSVNAAIVAVLTWWVEEEISRPGFQEQAEDLIQVAIDDLSHQSDLCCVLFTGAGRAFSAGGDLESYVELQRDPVAFPRFVADIHRVFGRLRDLHQGHV